MSNVQFLVTAGWVGRVPPGLKEFFNLPFLVLKAGHPVTKESICVLLSIVVTGVEYKD